MGHVISGGGREIGRLTDELVRRQQPDGTWRYCFENGTAMDVSVIVLLRSLSAGSEEADPFAARPHPRRAAARGLLAMV